MFEILSNYEATTADLAKAFVDLEEKERSAAEKAGTARDQVLSLLQDRMDGHDVQKAMKTANAESEEANNEHAAIRKAMTALQEVRIPNRWKKELQTRLRVIGEEQKSLLEDQEKGKRHFLKLAAVAAIAHEALEGLKSHFYGGEIRFYLPEFAIDIARMTTEEQQIYEAEILRLRTGPPQPGIRQRGMDLERERMKIASLIENFNPTTVVEALVKAAGSKAFPNPPAAEVPLSPNVAHATPWVNNESAENASERGRLILKMKRPENSVGFSIHS
jgi:hypothetical protein